MAWTFTAGFKCLWSGKAFCYTLSESESPIYQTKCDDVMAENTNQSTNQPTNKTPTNQPTNQPTN